MSKVSIKKVCEENDCSIPEAKDIIEKGNCSFSPNCQCDDCQSQKVTGLTSAL